MSTLNYSCDYSRQVLDSVLTQMNVEHEDVFSCTTQQCKKYVIGLMMWMRGGSTSYYVIENCRDALNENIPQLV